MTCTVSEPIPPTAARAARLAASEAIPWVPLGEGKTFKPLRFLPGDRGFVELLRLEPGVSIAWHRHTGEVHAYNLQGWRELHTGERVGPGDYVYEPAGNTDSWKAVGDVPLIVLVVVMGAVEYLGPGGAITARYAARDLLEIYRSFCRDRGISPADFVE